MFLHVEHKGLFFEICKMSKNESWFDKNSLRKNSWSEMGELLVLYGKTVTVYLQTNVIYIIIYN